jgi:catechol 2,3-dioxygenase-like lactoylglutathione lyase family enzyme
MALGDIACVTISTMDYQASLSFYEHLGFKKVGGDATDEETTFLSDGILFLLLKTGGESHSELTYFTDNLKETLKGLEALRINFSRTAPDEASFTDPSGLGVRLVQANVSKINKPQGKSWSKCGRFYEVSIETESVDSSIAFWKQLGFEVAFREPPTARWATLSDGKIKLGLYEYGTCPHTFKNPSLTYFEPDMAARIEQLKSEGVTFNEEMPNAEGKVDNAIAEAPDGQYFFLFFYDGEI